jgi:putative transcriptional regulator
MLIINLRKLLFDKNWNVSDLYRATGGDEDGVRYDTLLAYYHQYIKRINVKDIIKICDALGCTPGELFEYVPNKKKG